MGLYKIEFKTSVSKDLSKLPSKIVLRALKAVNNLLSEPFPSQSKKLQDCDNIYRIRIGDYRIIYEVNKDNKIITIYYIRHRKDVYRSL